MIYFRSGRHVVSVCAAIAMLAGCGGAGSGNGVVPTSGAPYDHLPNHKSFDYTGAAQYFTVPAGLRQIKVDARGAKGAGFTIIYGGRVRAVIPVTSGEKLIVLRQAVTLLEQLLVLTAAAVAPLAATSPRTGMAAVARPTCARAATRFWIASWSLAAAVVTVKLQYLRLQVHGRKGRWAHWRQRHRR